jgi:hypothetical protein
MRCFFFLALALAVTAPVSRATSQVTVLQEPDLGLLSVTRDWSRAWIMNDGLRHVIDDVHARA